MRVAIEGCCHGELDRIYASLANLQRVEKFTVDLLLICGDFQSIRNSGDLSSLACPDKYRALGTFYKYYSGEKRAPIPTIFIGGNHEASAFLWELYHGGWVAPNIYYLGFAGVVNFGGLRISGLSGIFKKADYDCGYFERQPFNDSHIRSVYHVRKFNVYRLAQIRQPIDIMLSHDWPRGIAMHGNTRQLVTNKPFLAGEINTNTLGSYPSEFLLKRLRPAYWFAAHLHVKFAAIYNHEQTAAVLPQPPPVEKNVAAAMVENPDEIAILSEDDSEPIVVADDDAQTHGNEDATKPDSAESKEEISAAQPGDSDAAKPEAMDTDGAATSPPGSPEVARADAKQRAKFTKFLALDKCLPNHDFLQIVNFPEADDSSLFLSYDEEWLAIMRATHDLFSASKEQKKVPEDSEIARRIAEDLQWVQENVPDLRVPHNFVITSPAHVPPANPGSKAPRATRSGKPYLNPQTTALCELLGLKNNINVGGLAPGAVDPALAPPPPPPPPPPKGTPKAKRVKIQLPLPTKADPMEELPDVVGPVEADKDVQPPPPESTAESAGEGEVTETIDLASTMPQESVEAVASYADNDEPEYRDYKTEEDDSEGVEEGEAETDDEQRAKALPVSDEVLFLTRFLGKGEDGEDEASDEESDDDEGEESKPSDVTFSIDKKGSSPS
ncbi:lariat debranching enzyme [Geranomyces michiganensis]|nr:lariat debranching enzyme [Geranomyces michiganensis]